MSRGRRRDGRAAAAPAAPSSGAAAADPPAIAARHTPPVAPAARADEPPAPPRGPLAWVALALAAAALGAYVWVAVARMGFPFELEWMEGGVLGHVQRVLAGKPLYVAPTLEFVPFIYPPLYFEAAAMLSRVLGPSLTTLRLLSFVASLASLTFIAVLVRGGRRGWVPGVMAAGLFAATFSEGGAWLDLARVDSLAFALMLGGWVLLRVERRVTPAAAAAGVLMSLAFLTKQATAAAIPPALVALALFDRRRLWPFAAAVVLVAGGATWMLDQGSHGWYRYYVFELPREHPIIGQLLRGFWITDLVGPVGLGLAIGAAHWFAPGAWSSSGGDAAQRQRRARRALDGGIVVALLLTGYLTRVRVGSFDNVVIPAYVAAAVAFGLGLGTLDRLRATAGPGARRAGEAFVAFLCVAQFALLAYKPWTQIPPAADVVAGQGVVESLRRVPGDVWVPFHPYLVALAGKPAHAHDLAVRDVLRAGKGAPYDSLRAEITAAIHTRRYAAIVLDGQVWLQDEIRADYDEVARMFGPGEDKLFWPMTGFYTRPYFVYMPKRAAAPDSTP